MDLRIFKYALFELQYDITNYINTFRHIYSTSEIEIFMEIII
jgi:hypothetical protein